jgi:hypothetical protein
LEWVFLATGDEDAWIDALIARKIGQGRVGRRVLSHYGECQPACKCLKAERLMRESSITEKSEPQRPTAETTTGKPVLRRFLVESVSGIVKLTRLGTAVDGVVSRDSMTPAEAIDLGERLVAIGRKAADE